MIGLEDRQTMVRHIDTAHAAGARLRPACEVAGITVRTLQRWKAEDGLHVGDRRPLAERPTPAHALTEEERALLRARDWRGLMHYGVIFFMLEKLGAVATCVVGVRERWGARVRPR